MLFFYFLAGLSGAAGWMAFWAFLGLICSARPKHFFVLPLIAALIGNVDLGMLIAVATWLYIAWSDINKARTEEKQHAAEQKLLSN